MLLLFGVIWLFNILCFFFGKLDFDDDIDEL